ncbi:MAG: low temperature requirement protein A, partial [Acidimicrobiia bacterium]
MSMLAEFRRRFWLPPRAHGQVIEDRTVSFLELFYDLVYVVVIGRAAHHLAGDVSWRGVGEFAVLFSLTWIAWLNGTLYYELHGREEGRTRFYVFVQMLLLALLAVFIDGAGGSDGVPFGVVYMLYLAVLSWLWYTVRLQDEEQYMASTARYLAGMVISILVVGLSLFLSVEGRMIAWAGVVLMWLVGSFLLARMAGRQSGVRVTDSLVERYGLFVIIVLGEVVV